MPRIPMYEQQTSVNAPTASPGDFGANVGEAMGQTGSVLQDIGAQMKRREDVIDRVQRMNAFDQYAQESMTALSSAEDFGSKSTVDKYVTGLRQKQDELLNQHGGTGQSRAELRAQMENQVGQYHKGAVAAQIKTQHTMIATRVDTAVNELAIKGSFAPAAINEVFASLDAELLQFKDAVSPGQLNEYRMAGQQRIATGVMQGLMTQGKYAETIGLLKDPTVGPMLDPNTARKFSIDAQVGQYKDESEVKRQSANVARLTAIAGRNLTPEEMVKARALPSPKDMGPADHIAEYEVITGKPATQGQVEKAYKIAGEAGGSGIFGNSMTGRAWDIMTNGATAYAAGMMDEQQRREYESAIAIVSAPQRRLDPTTGEMVEYTVPIPSFVQQAVGMGGQRPAPRQMGQPSTTTPSLYDKGQFVGTLGTNSQGGWSVKIPPGGPGYVQPGDPSQGGWTTDELNQAAAQRQGGGATGSWGEPDSQPVAPQGTSADDGKRGLWDMAEDVSGPVAALTAGLGNLPFSTGVGGMQTQARQEVLLIQKQLIKALQQNPRYAEGERKSIEDEIKIEPSMFNNKDAYRHRLIAIDNVLLKELEANARILSGKTPTTKEQRQQAMHSTEVINEYRSSAKLPQRVKTTDESDKLPKGTVFIDPNGNIWKR